MRGGGPPGQHCTDIHLGSSPHARGWSHTLPAYSRSGTVFPACAGVVPDARTIVVAGMGLPRMRGGGPVGFVLRANGVLSSPHARGWSGHVGEAEEEA